METLQEIWDRVSRPDKAVGSKIRKVKVKSPTNQSVFVLERLFKSQRYALVYNYGKRGFKRFKRYRHIYRSDSCRWEVLKERRRNEKNRNSG